MPRARRVPTLLEDEDDGEVRDWGARGLRGSLSPRNNRVGAPGSTGGAAAHGQHAHAHSARQRREIDVALEERKLAHTAREQAKGTVEPPPKQTESTTPAVAKVLAQHKNSGAPCSPSSERRAALGRRRCAQNQPLMVFRARERHLPFWLLHAARAQRDGLLRGRR